MPHIKKIYFCSSTHLHAIRLITILLGFTFIYSAQAASDLVVRWHGDYFQHRWILGIPGGAPSEIKENRWLRGGPPLGKVQTLFLDEDGDGDMDDSRVLLEFSLDEPLNPPAVTTKPNGIFYHEDLPSARFYGGLSASFYNHHTNRIDQAYIENDGAGGDPADVGYTPSPYIAGGAEYDQDWLDFLEERRHPVDGRYGKNHRGPHEDFAISIYNPAFVHSLLDPSEDPPEDNLAAYHGAFLWKKEDFLADGDQKRVTLDAASTFSFESTRWWDEVGEVRWIIQDSDNQLYVSEFSVAGLLDNFGFKNEFVDPLSSLWARYNPADVTIDFDQNDTNLVWHDPVVEGLFSDIRALGLYIENDTPSGDLSRFSFDEVRFEAQVIDLFDSADFNTDGFVDASDLSTLQAALGNSDLGDADGDGDTDGDDFLLWQNQFTGSGGGLSSPLSSSVPEPNTILLLTILLAIVSCWSRRANASSGRAKEIYR